MGWITLVLVVPLAALSDVGGRAYDRDGDGVAEPVAAQTVMADLNRDGVFEQLRYEGNLLTVVRDALAEGKVIEFPEAIRDVSTRDTDHDGLPDVNITLASGSVVHLNRRALLSDESNATGGGATRGPVAGPTPCSDLIETWDSGADLNNLWGVAADDLDSDGLSGILTMTWPTPRMYVYENDGDDSFSLVFTTPSADAPPGAYVTVTSGDSDLDGQRELIGGETSTLNQIFLYERTGDNTYAKRDIGVAESDFTGEMSMGKVKVADVDADGKMEIIFDASGVAGSELYIYEHSGVVGDNTYTKVFTYSTVSFLFNWAIGDSDNDGNNEIVLGFGGSGGFPINLRRLENTGDNTYVHSIVQPGGVGLALAPTVADVDGDGANELIFGGVINGLGGGVFIYESTGNDTYALAFSEGGLSGNGLASTVAPLQCGAEPIIAVGAFSGELDTWRFDGDTYLRALATPLMSQGAIRALDIGLLDGDAKTDLVLSSGAGDNRVHVYEVVGGPVVPAVSSWGMVVMAMLVCTVGAVVLRRKQCDRQMVG